MRQLPVQYQAYGMIGVTNHISDWSAPNFQENPICSTGSYCSQRRSGFLAMICCCRHLLCHCLCSSLQQANKAIIVASTKRLAYTCKNLQHTLHSLGRFLGKSLNFREFETRIQAGTEPIPTFSIPLLNSLIALFHTRTLSKQFAKTNTTISFCIRITRNLQFSLCLFFVFYLHYLHQVLKSRRNEFFLPKGKTSFLGGGGAYDTPSFPWRNIVREAHTRLMSPSVRLSVRLSVRNTKTRRIITQELKSGCPRGVFCPSSIPSEYLFLCARKKLGFNKKICTKLLIVYMNFKPNSCNTHAEREWARRTFLRQQRKVPPAHAQRVCPCSKRPSLCNKLHSPNQSLQYRGKGELVVELAQQQIWHSSSQQQIWHMTLLEKFYGVLKFLFILEYR